MDVEGFYAELTTEGRTRDRLQPADGSQPKQLEVLAQVVVEWQDIDRITREVGPCLLRLDDRGDSDRRVVCRDLADENRRGHPNRRRHVDDGLDGAADGRKQLRTVGPAQGQPVEPEEGTARILAGSHVGGEVVQG